MDDQLRDALGEGQRLGARYALARPEAAPLGHMGARLGHRPGSSLEFMDHRDYQPGDDLRRVDWSAYARSDRLTVKLYREEVSPHVDVVLDGSSSMDLPETDKARGAAALCALLATAAVNGGMTHRVYLAAEGFRPVPGGEHRPAGWQALQFEGERSVADAFAALPPNWRRQGVRVLVSDLLWPGDPLPIMRRLSEGAAAMHVVQLLARADRQPPRRGNVRLVDSETGALRELFVDASAERRYLEALQQHQAQWQAACRQVGAILTPIVAEDVLAGDVTPLIDAQLLGVA